MTKVIKMSVIIFNVYIYSNLQIFKSSADKLYLIDVQDGCVGPLLYDLASLVYDSNIIISKEEREQLLCYYYEQKGDINTIIDYDEFVKYVTCLGKCTIMKYDCYVI